MSSKEPVKTITQTTPPRAESATFHYRLWPPISAIFGFAFFIWLLHWVRRMYRFHSWDW